MGLQQWAIEQSRRDWHNQAGAIEMLRGEARRARTGESRTRLLIERRAPLHHG